MPKVVDKEQKSEEIARAALRVFRELGYHRTRMADIAREACVGKGTLYEYFRDKADILRRAFDDYFTAFKAGAMEALQRAAGPSERLLALVDFALSHTQEWEDHCAVYVDYFGAARTGGGDLFSLANIYAEVRGLLAPLIEEGQAAGEIAADLEPGATAQLLLSIFEGLVLYRIFEQEHGGAESVRSMARLLARKLLVVPTQGPAPNTKGDD